MKNKFNFKFFYFLFFLFFLNNNVYSEQRFTYEAKDISIQNNGKNIEGKGEVKIIINNDIIIFADKLKYNRITELLELEGKIILKDQKNDISIQATELFFLKNEGMIFSKTASKFKIKKNYTIEANDFNYFIDKKKIISKNQVLISDLIGNLFYIDSFSYQGDKDIFKGENTRFIDVEKNEYLITNTMIDLNKNIILGKDLNINFNKTLFGNQENDPRLKAATFTKKNQISTFNKGVFTTCKKNDDCPPWSLYADKISHDKNKKTIFYKNAWLKIYDKPLVYFPKFSHPDPTVKRQSGFLAPIMSSSKNLGTSLEIPYFYVLSNNKDLTFRPRFYLNDETVIQNEYRQVNKNSSHVVDASLNSSDYLTSKKGNKAHIFTNSKFDLGTGYFDISNLELNLQHVSNDTYLKKYKIDSSLIDNETILSSYFTFTGQSEDLYVTSSIGSYQDLSKTKKDRYEFIYPNYEIIKNFEGVNSNFSEITLSSYGYQKKYETNIYEGLNSNSLFLKSNKKYFTWGGTNTFSTLFRNVNDKGNNSPKYKSGLNQSLLSLIKLDHELPLEKSSEKFEDTLTPKLSFMYSPNKTKNMTQDEGRLVNVNNIFSINRLSAKDTVEGGASVTLGAEYNKLHKKSRKELLNFNLATILRKNENDDLPLISNMGEKNSNLFGNLKFSPYENFDLNYNFEINKNFNKSDYDLFKTNYKVNNFVTSFEYLDDKNINNKRSYISNNSSLVLSKNNSIGFNIRKNKITNATEFYDVYFSYFNDCLEASIKFNKEYYRDSDLEPEKQILLSLTIVPFGKIDNIGLNE